MGTSKRYSAEVRERAVRLVAEQREQHGSQWAAIQSIASKIGCTAESLRRWVQQAERDRGVRPGLSSSERDRVKELERETHLQVLKSDKAPTSDHWMWVRASGPPGRRIILFDYDASRAGAVPRRLLEDYRGILLTDGYEAYEAVARSLSLAHAGCFAHVRRKFDEARKAQSQQNADSHARIALDFIRELYAVERALWDKDQPVAPEHRINVRTQLSAPIMAKFRTWLEALASQVLPQSLLGKAVHYTLGQWPKLTTFLTHGDVPLDNNRCENAIRPFVVGRKGWLFSDTVKGAVASANLYSLVETAKANGVEPHAYLTLLFDRLPHATTVEDFEALLPWHLKAELASGASL